MGIFDALGDAAKSALGGMIGQIDGDTLPALLPKILAQTGLGDVGGLLAQMQSSGLGDQVASWLGNGANEPLSAEQLRAALGDQHVQQIAHSLGLPVDDMLGSLAKYLPQAIDTMSPDGTLRQG